MTKKNRNIKWRWILVAAALVLLTVVGVAGYLIRDMGYRLTGYAAKQACSLVFVSQQPLEDVLVELREDNPYIRYVDVQINQQPAGVTASISGWFEQSAIYRSPVGATIVIPDYDQAIANFPLPDFPLEAADTANRSAFVPIGAADVNLLNQIDIPVLARAFKYAFTEPNNGSSHRRTRAAIVVWHDHVIAEKYHPDFGPDSLLLGWSMSKSVLNLMIGRRIYLGGNLSLASTGLREEWLKDNRKDISLEQLLRMESGLHFEETYSPMADVLTMLYRTPDMGSYAASFGRKDSSNKKHWQYSSGTTNIISQMLRRSFGSDKEYVRFIWQDFLLPLGIRTAQLEFDASGTWVGSSYMYATARDWAKIGKLVLDNGEWEGKQFLPADWIRQTATPTASYRENPTTGDPPGRSYGMHWWLNRKDANGRNWMPSIPEDTIVAWGHFGQYVVVIPSRQLIAVRLGLSKGPEGWDLEKFLKSVLLSLPVN